MTASQPDNGPRVFPTSFAQQRIWTVVQLADNSSAYNMPVALRLDGALDAGALIAALEESVRRHDVLRTGLVAGPDGPVQVVRQDAALVVEQTDVSGGDAEQELDALLAVDARRPFDLATPPLIRARLIKAAAERHVLSLCLHHSVADGWSVALLLSDIAALYAAGECGAPVSAPPAAGYADYAIGQRAALTSRRRAELSDFWADYLAGTRDALQLATSYPRPAVQSYAGSVVSGRMDAADRDRLLAVARQESASLYMALLAGLATLLARNSGDDDIVIGSPVADRSHGDFNDVVGLFLDTQVVRIGLTGRPTFRELLTRVRASSIDAFVHNDFPFEELVGLIRPERSAAHHPLFQVMLTLQPAAGMAPEFAGLRVTELPPPDTATVPFDLSLSVTEDPTGLGLSLRYSTDLFDAAAASELLEQFVTLLGVVAGEPDRPVCQFPLATPAQQEIVQAFGHGDPAPDVTDPDQCLPALIEAQAASTPDAPAVSDSAGSLTYGELDTDANRLAHRLAGRGAGPESLVAVAARRGTGFITAINAVWRAGAAFVPIDPDQPAERQREVIRQANVRSVVVDADGRRALTAALAELDPEDRPILIDLDPRLHRDQPADRLPRGYVPANLAYVIFTSGTTGEPKGAMVTHDGLVNHVRAKNLDVGMSDTDVLAQNGPSTFDVVVWQCTAPLVLGGRVHVVDDRVIRDPDEFAAELRRGGVTVLQAVPSLIGLLLSGQPCERSLGALRWMVSTGDALPRDLALRWAETYPGIALLNTYGVTECSDDQFHGVVEATPVRHSGAIIEIGRPIAGMSGHLLDAELTLTPTNVVGQLYLGGLGVGRGYLGRPALTAERFVPDPNGAPGARMYRSGDTFRRRGDGTLEFLGRADFQLKIRGFRIEPVEVEIALTRHPEIQGALVTAYGPVGPERRLVGYLVPRGAVVPVSDVRRFLAAELPDYMIPQQLIWLDEMPVTRHGKLDRAALPEVTAAEQAEEEAPAAPLDAIAEVVAGLWASVLGREGIGPDEGFFHIGGTSLMAVDLLQRLRATCAVPMTMVDLLEVPTIAGNAAVVRRGLRAGNVTVADGDIPRRNEGEPAAMSHAQEMIWVHDQVTQEPALYVVSFVIRLDLAIGEDQFRAAVQQLTARHDVLRTALMDREGRRLQVVADRVSAAVTFEDLTVMPERDRRTHVEAVMRAEARAGFRLDEAPLLRLRVFRLDGTEMFLGFVLHHAITDAWSNDIMVRDLLALLHARVQGTEAVLPALPVRYVDHSVWQRAGLGPERQAELLRYWLDRLDGAPELSTFPGDRPRPTAPSHRGGVERITISADLVRTAAALGRIEGASGFMMLLSAVYAVLSRFSGSPDVVLGCPVAGRDHPQSHHLMGCFVNTIPLRINLQPAITVRELLRGVRDTCLSAYAHSDLPFGVLLERLNLRREVGNHPVFQVMLSFAGRRPGESGRENLAADLPHVAKDTARFDLSIDVIEVEGEWRIALEYATDLYDGATIARIGRGIEELLAAACQDPEQRVAALPVMSPAEKAAVDSWRAGPAVSVPAATLPELVHAQVLRTPSATALIDDRGEITYREFWDRVSALAAALRERGLGADDVVGICLDRGIEQVIAVHGVLASGAAYLPLDPASPPARRRFLVDDVGATTVIADSGVSFGAHVVSIEPNSYPAVTGGGAPISVPLECLAYTMHTSGSTGRPKGVQISQRAAVSYLTGLRAVLDLDPADRVLYKTAFGFDVSVTELFWPLITGAAVVVGDRSVHREPVRLAELVETHGVRILQFVPSILGPFLDHVERTGGPPAGLRDVISLGEALSPRLAERFRRLCPSVRLHNMYGPTEATVVVTWQPLDGPAEVVPIGRPMPGVHVEILDDDLRMTGSGMSGHLYLGGAQLARGYAGRPGLTAQRFVPDPRRPGKRLYATGDIARWGADGTIELLGRADNQVKIRGVRVEPGEIESALLSHGSVAQAVVVASDGRLVAYLVSPTGGSEPSSAELRGYLRDFLPGAFVPARYVWLAALPLLPNGKIDRTMLPEPDPNVVEQTVFVPPADGMERLLAAAWKQILGVPQVGAHDNFFDLGGDSILSLLVVSQVAKAGVEVTPRQFFEHQTVATLARVATRAGARRAGPATRPRATRIDTTTAGRVLDLLRAADQTMGDRDDQRD